MVLVLAALLFITAIVGGLAVLGRAATVLALLAAAGSFLVLRAGLHIFSAARVLTVFFAAARHGFFVVFSGRSMAHAGHALVHVGVIGRIRLICTTRTSGFRVLGSRLLLLGSWGWGGGLGPRDEGQGQESRDQFRLHMKISV